MGPKRILTYAQRILERFIFTELLASACAKYLSQYYNHLQWEQWHKGSPEWFDHRIDLYRWPDHLNPHWVERGTYSKEVMFPGCKVLDLASGDGFYAFYFYVATGASIDCIDLNPKAIRHAEKYHSHPSIRHFELDAVKDGFPRTSYDVICFDGALDHFSNAQLDIVLQKIKNALGSNGVLTCYQEIGYHPPDDEHPVCFQTEEELAERLCPYFKFIGIITTSTPGRFNAYVRCSDSEEKMRRFRIHTEFPKLG